MTILKISNFDRRVENYLTSTVNITLIREKFHKIVTHTLNMTRLYLGRLVLSEERLYLTCVFFQFCEMFLREQSPTSISYIASISEISVNLELCSS